MTKIYFLILLAGGINAAPAKQGQETNRPQLVLFQFSNLVDTESCHHYLTLFREERRNPNGCPISATFLLSNTWKGVETTDYECIRDLYQAGYEMAVHSINHEWSGKWWDKASVHDWVGEMVGMRQLLHDKAGVPLDAVRGTFCPAYKYTHISENHIQMMAENGFQYDISVLQDYEHADIYDLCKGNEEFCAKKNISGVLELPRTRMVSPDGRKKCVFMSDCYRSSASLDHILNYYKFNFNREYENDRRPLRFFADRRLFYNEKNTGGLDMFLQYLLTLEDVYIVTEYEAVQWWREQQDGVKMDHSLVLKGKCN